MWRRSTRKSWVRRCDEESGAFLVLNLRCYFDIDGFVRVSPLDDLRGEVWTGVKGRQLELFTRNNNLEHECTSRSPATVTMKTRKVMKLEIGVLGEKVRCCERPSKSLCRSWKHACDKRSTHILHAHVSHKTKDVKRIYAPHSSTNCSSEQNRPERPRPISLVCNRIQHRPRDLKEALKHSGRID